MKKENQPVRIGLALGGGGARGLAHIPMLCVFDELGIKPACISGTSIGAVFGAMYASGMGSSGICDIIKQITGQSPREQLRSAIKNKKPPKWLQFFDFSFSRNGLFHGDKFIAFLYETMGKSTFEELETPLKVVATDSETSEQIVFQKGPLLSAVKASMGIPGMFTPVTLNNHILIDGGGCNPVPYDILFNECDIVIAIDVLGQTDPLTRGVPDAVHSALHMFDIMQKSIMREKLKNRHPDIYIKPAITGIELLDFFKAQKIFHQAEPEARRLKTQLQKLLNL